MTSEKLNRAIELGYKGDTRNEEAVINFLWDKQTPIVTEYDERDPDMVRPMSDCENFQKLYIYDEAEKAFQQIENCDSPNYTEVYYFQDRQLGNDGYLYDYVKLDEQHECTRYEIIFNDDNCSDSPGSFATLDEAKEWIELHRPNESYFEDYKGGVVSVYDNLNQKIVYAENISK